MLIVSAFMRQFKELRPDALKRNIAIQYGWSGSARWHCGICDGIAAFSAPPFIQHDVMEAIVHFYIHHRYARTHPREDRA